MLCLKDLRSLVILFALPLLSIATEYCNCPTGTILRSQDIAVVPINEFYCANISRGQTWEDWKTRKVELPKQHVHRPGKDLVIDYFVSWPWYLKGMRVSVCNSMGHRPNISWPDIGYSPVNVECSFDDYPRCPEGLDVFAVQYQSWLPWD